MDCNLSIASGAISHQNTRTCNFTRTQLYKHVISVLKDEYNFFAPLITFIHSQTNKHYSSVSKAEYMYNFILSQTHINMIFLFQKSTITVEYNFIHSQTYKHEIPVYKALYTARHIDVIFLLKRPVLIV